MITPPKPLPQLQKEFPAAIASLISYIYKSGYQVSFGDAFRDPRLHGEIGIKKGYGHPKSAHKQRLAIDLNLFKDGKYLDKTQDHQIFGAYWEKLHPAARWGGRFNDGNHYSFEYDGVM